MSWVARSGSRGGCAAGLAVGGAGAAAATGAGVAGPRPAALSSFSSSSCAKV